MALKLGKRLSFFRERVCRQAIGWLLTGYAEAPMEADPTKADNQDDPSSVAALRKVDATGFIRLNGLHLKVAAKVQRKKK